MWSFEHTEITAATPAQLWERYSDHATWPEWDRDTEWVTADGPLAVGTTGVLKPVGGPRTAFRVEEATPGVSFTDVSALPLARLRFAHRIEVSGDSTRFTHRVTITGPLSGLFGRLIGRKIAAEMPATMRALAALAAGVRTP